jgi:hypothetical protein
MIEELKNSTAIARALDAHRPDESKADVPASNAEAPSAESRAVVPAGDTDSISTTLAALYARSPDRIEAVVQRTTTLRGLLRRTNDDFLEIGRQLIEQRHDIKPGCWQKYLRNVLGVSQPSAFQAIRAVEPFGALPGNVLANFDRHAICLLSPPSVSEARAEAVKRAKAGEHITKTVAQALVAPEPEPVAPATIEPEATATEPQPSDPEQLEQHDLEQHDQSDAEPEPTGTEIAEIAGQVVRLLEHAQPEPEPSEDPQPNEDTPKPTAAEPTATKPTADRPRQSRGRREPRTSTQSKSTVLEPKKASSLEPRPPVSRMIDSLELLKVCDPPLERAQDKTKLIDHGQVGRDIYNLIDKVRLWIVKMTEPQTENSAERKAAG